MKKVIMPSRCALRFMAHCAVALAMFGFVSCDEKIPAPDVPDVPEEEVKPEPEPEVTSGGNLPMSVIVDQSVLNGYITNYKTKTRAGSLSWDDVLSQFGFQSWWPEQRMVYPFAEARDMWGAAVPGDLSAYPKISTLNIQNGGLPDDVKNQHVFCIEGTLESSFEAGDQTNKYTIYVLGNLTVTRSQNNVEFVVCKGGSITVRSSQQLGNIFNYSETPVIVEGGTSVNGKIVSYSGVRATGDVRFENASQNALICSTFEGTNININDQANVAVGCMKLSGTAKVENRSLYIEHGMEVGVIDLSATGKIVCANGAVMHASSAGAQYAINLGNTHQAIECMQVYEGDSPYAVLLAANDNGRLPVRLGTTDRTGYQTSNSYVVISGDLKFEGGGSGVADLGNARLEPDPETSVVNRGCGDNYGPAHKWTEVLEELTDIAPVDHVHPISATGITLEGNTAYISWHLRGGSIHGCIEKITMSGGRGTINGWMETREWDYYSGMDGANVDSAVDFNHISLEGSYILTVGEHAKKGGILGRIPKSAFSTGGNTQNILEIKGLGREVKGDDGKYKIVAGGSGNSLAFTPDKSRILITSHGGHSTMPYGESLEFKDIKQKDITAVAANGSAKHIATYGGYAVTIEYTKYGNDVGADWWEDRESTCPAVIKLWNVNDYPNTCQASMDVPEFAPIYGKDVIAIDANYIYSCQGKNGVGIYSYTGSSITEVCRVDYNGYLSGIRPEDRELERVSRGAANGLCVANNRLYVANDYAGIWVYDLSQGVSGKLPLLGYGLSAPHISQIDGAHDESLPDDASANYVVATDQYIYVAYGRHGVRIFRNL